MKPSDFQKTVQCRFESCLKKVVRSVVKDYYKELNVYIVVDMELKGRIREALIKMILGFDIEDMDLEPEE